jgi:hypothetical protein
MAGKSPTKLDDFDADKIAVTVDQHAKDIGALSEKVKCLEERFGSSISLANTLSDASKEAVKLKEMLAESFLELLQKNDAVRNEIRGFIKVVDREYVSQKLKQYRTWIAAGALFLAAQFSIELVKWSFKVLTLPKLPAPPGG